MLENFSYPLSNYIVNIALKHIRQNMKYYLLPCDKEHFLNVYIDFDHKVTLLLC